MIRRSDFGTGAFGRTNISGASSAGPPARESAAQVRRSGAAKSPPAGPAGAANLPGQLARIWKRLRRWPVRRVCGPAGKATMSETRNLPVDLPVVPMRNSVLFPGVSVPISAGRPATLRAIEAAINSQERRVFAVAQRNDDDKVTPETLHTIGTIATISSVQRGIGAVRLLLEGEGRGIALRISPKKGYLEAHVQRAIEMLPLDPKDPAFIALYREARERAAELGKKLGLPDEAVEQILSQVDEPGRLADLVAGYIDIPAAERQALLETLSVEDRLRRVLVHVQRQIEVLSVQADIQEKVKEEIGGRQREAYLREQLKAIQKELGEGEGSADESLKELKTKLDALVLPEEA